MASVKMADKIFFLVIYPLVFYLRTSRAEQGKDTLTDLINNLKSLLHPRISMNFDLFRYLTRNVGIENVNNKFLPLEMNIGVPESGYLRIIFSGYTYTYHVGKKSRAHAELFFL